MTKYQIITAYDALQRAAKEKIKIVDIRDGQSYREGHAQGAFHLTNDTLETFMQEVELNTPVFVICYHGNSSKGVAQYLCDQGYQSVYSVAGGMADWRLICP